MYIREMKKISCYQKGNMPEGIGAELVNVNKINWCCGNIFCLYWWKTCQATDMRCPDRGRKKRRYISTKKSKYSGKK